MSYPAGMAMRRLQVSAPRVAAIVALATVCVLMGHAQISNRTALAGNIVWKLRSRIPLGTDSLLLQPSKRIVHLVASAEAPAFEGWKVVPRKDRPVLLDASDKP